MSIQRPIDSDAERRRLNEVRESRVPWYRWGPSLIEVLREYAMNRSATWNCLS